MASATSGILAHTIPALASAQLTALSPWPRLQALRVKKHLQPFASVNRK
jgi:hypothetical protein